MNGLTDRWVAVLGLKRALGVGIFDWLGSRVRDRRRAAAIGRSHGGPGNVASTVMRRPSITMVR